ncbi:hypothetical protein [Acinetobacter lwoffii]|uniref:hypothetical protein n=1 Tax=Acinetobacter lwoffii TaxID=28090 RepID=UPI00168CDADE|nr:hypothetical protein [Acinetobacter lwoffii]
MSNLNKWTSDECCTKQDVARFHEQTRILYEAENPLYVNAICLNCNTHWHRLYGQEVEKFTSKEWDAHINFLCENIAILDHLHSIKCPNFKSETQRFIGMNQDELNYWNIYFSEGFGGAA